MFQGFLAIVAAFAMIKWREKIVEATGKFDWCEKYLGYGGTYRFFVILAVVFFLWGVAKITGTEDVLLSPLNNFFNPGGRGASTGNEWDF